MTKKLAPIVGPLVVFALPIFVYAQDADSIITKVQTWIGKLIPIVFALCLLVFLWGLVTFIAKSGDEEARKQGKQKMLWGIIALFVAAMIWGLVNFIGRTLGVNSESAPDSPGIPGYKP